VDIIYCLTLFSYLLELANVLSQSLLIAQVDNLSSSYE